MLEFLKTTANYIKNGRTPLNHDCIVKVSFIPESGLRFQYFTCRSQDSGAIGLILSELALIARIEFVSIDECDDIL